MANQPALPPGFTLDTQGPQPPLPQGFTLDEEDQDPLMQLQNLLAKQSKGEQGLGEQIAQLRQSTNQPDTDQGGFFGQGGFTELDKEKVGTLGSFGQGVKQGGADVGTGLITAFNELRVALGDEEAQKVIDKVQFANQARRVETEAQTEGHPIAKFAGEVVGESLALPLPVAKGASLLTRVGQSAAVGGGAGAISSLGKNESAIQGALIGAGFGAGFAALAEPMKKAAVKIINATKGRFGSKEIQELVEISKKENIPLFSSDVLDSPGLSRLDTLAEDVPITGTRAGRVEQGAKQEVAAKRLLGELAGDVEDFAIGAQKGIQDRLKRAKKIAGVKFNKVNKLLNNKGDVQKTKFVDTLNEQITEVKAKGTRANEPLINMMEQFRDSPNGNFETIRNQRADLAGEISKFYKGDNSVLGEADVIHLQKAKNALEADIQSFVKQTKSEGGIKAFRDANKFVQKNTAPFKKGALKRLINNDEPEKIIAFLSANGKTSRANLLFDKMDNKGRQAVRAAMVQSAVNKAGSAGKRFSPNAFASELEKLQSTTNVFFKGSDKAQLEGLKKIMRAGGRSGQISENPATGARLLIPAVVGGAATGGISSIATNVIGVGGFGGLMRILNQTELGKKALIGLGKSTKDTKNFERSVDIINTILTRAATRSETDNG